MSYIVKYLREKKTQYKLS